MRVIPSDILEVLTALLIKDPATSRWVHLAEWPTRFMHAHHYCDCGTRADGEQKVEMAFVWLRDRKVFCGQCRWCGTIYWRDAVSDR
jgi:hypothetical protein